MIYTAAERLGSGLAPCSASQTSFAESQKTDGRLPLPQISSKTRFKEERAERDCTPARSRPPCDAVSPSTANPSRLNEMTQQSDDLAMLSRAFEDALTELLLEVLMEGGTSFDRQMKLRLARNRLRRHKDFTEKEYQAAVLRAARRALPSE